MNIARHLTKKPAFFTENTMTRFGLVLITANAAFASIMIASLLIAFILFFIGISHDTPSVEVAYETTFTIIAFAAACFLGIGRYQDLYKQNIKTKKQFDSLEEDYSTKAEILFQELESVSQNLEDDIKAIKNELPQEAPRLPGNKPRSFFEKLLHHPLSQSSFTLLGVGSFILMRINHGVSLAPHITMSHNSIFLFLGLLAIVPSIGVFFLTQYSFKQKTENDNVNNRNFQLYYFRMQALIEVLKMHLEEHDIRGLDTLLQSKKVNSESKPAFNIETILTEYKKAKTSQCFWRQLQYFNFSFSAFLVASFFFILVLDVTHLIDENAEVFVSLGFVTFILSIGFALRKANLISKRSNDKEKKQLAKTNTFFERINLQLHNISHVLLKVSHHVEYKINELNKLKKLQASGMGYGAPDIPIQDLQNITELNKIITTSITKDKKIAAWLEKLPQFRHKMILKHSIIQGICIFISMLSLISLHLLIVHALDHIDVHQYLYSALFGIVISLAIILSFVISWFSYQNTKHDFERQSENHRYIKNSFREVEIKMDKIYDQIAAKQGELDVVNKELYEILEKRVPPNEPE